MFITGMSGCSEDIYISPSLYHWFLETLNGPETPSRNCFGPSGLMLMFLIFSCRRWQPYSPPSSTQASPAKIACVSVYSPCLFGKGIVVHARQTCEQQTSNLLKQNLSETIKPIDNSCMLSPNPSINPAVC